MNQEKVKLKSMELVQLADFINKSETLPSLIDELPFEVIDPSSEFIQSISHESRRIDCYDVDQSGYTDEHKFYLSNGALLYKYDAKHGICKSGG